MKSGCSNFDGFQLEMDGFKARIAELIEEKLLLTNECDRMSRNLQLVKEELKEEKNRHAQYVKRIEEQLNSIEKQRKQELIAFKERGTRALDAMQKQMKEATSVVSRNNEIQYEWKEEAVKLSKEIDNVVTQQQGEKRKYEERIASLTVEMEKLRILPATLERKIEVLKKIKIDLEQRLCFMLHGKECLEQHLKDMNQDRCNIQETLNNTKKEMAVLKDRSKHVEREREIYKYRYETLKRRIKSKAVCKSISMPKKPEMTQIEDSFS